MLARSSRLIRALATAVVVLVVLGSIAWPFVSIQLRLARNGAIARQLVASLRAEFPTASVRGNASYELEVVYLTVVGLDEAGRRDVERRLREIKAERRIAPEIWLRFSDSTDEEKDMIKI